MSITTTAPYGFETEVMPLQAFGGVGGHRLKPIPGSLQLHGGVKKAIVPVLAITAAVVAPVAIPAMATAIGASAGIGVAASYAAAGAVYGATAGALTAAVGGGDIGRSALIGGAVGGVGGYLGAPAGADVAATGAGSGTGLGPTNAAAQSGQLATGPVTAPAAAPTVTTPPPSTGGLSAATGGPGIQGVDSISQQVAAGGAQTFASPVPSTATGSIGSTLSGTAGTTGGIGGTAVPSVMAQAPQITPQALGAGAGAGLGPTNAAAAAGQMVGGATPQPGVLERIGSGLKETGSAIADRFTDPQMQAELILRGAGQLAGSALAGSGLSEQQQQLVDMQAAELEQLRQTNEAAFNQRLQEAQRLIGEAEYFDPEYFGLQRAREQQTAGAQAKRAGLRGLTGEERRAEARRFDIATGRNVGTAYDQGYLTGVQGRLQTQEAGLRQLPMPSQYASATYGGLGNTLQSAETQRLRAAQNVGNLFGGLTGYSSSRSTG